MRSQLLRFAVFFVVWFAVLLALSTAETLLGWPDFDLSVGWFGALAFTAFVERRA